MKATRSRIEDCGTKLLLCCFLCLSLAACKVDFYTGLSQRDANEMLAVLVRGGVDAEAVPGKDDTVVLRVAESQQDLATELLMARGLPRHRSKSIGDIFNNEGLVSSPLEERARFVYAISEELSTTLAEIDGVLAVRVHVVIPEKERIEGRQADPSAAVFIKHQESYDFRVFIPQIKELVSNSVERLSYDNVSVVLFASSATDLLPQAAPRHQGAGVPGLLAKPGVALGIILSLGLLVVLLAGVLGYKLLHQQRAKAVAGEAG